MFDLTTSQLSQMKSLLIPSLAALSLPAQAANVIHYWDFEGTGGTELNDRVGSQNGTAVGTPVIGTVYGSAYAGSGNSLSQTRGSLGNYITVGSSGDFDFGTDDFAISFWYYDDQAGDGDNRQMRVLDSLNGTTTGISLGTNTSGLTCRFDDAGGGVVNATPAFLPTNTWVHVSINVDRTNDLMTIYRNGTSYHTESLASLNFGIAATQPMEIGVINGGDSTGNADVQSGALDDLAFYTGTLSTAQISGLAGGTLTPDQIPEPSSLLLLGFGGLGMLRRKR